MKTIYLVYRGTSGFDYFDEEAFRSFEDKQDADIFCQTVNDEHLRLLKEYSEQYSTYNRDYEMWCVGKHKVAPKTGPAPVRPSSPVNKYDPKNDDFSYTIGHDDESYSRVSYFTKTLELFATGEWQG